MESLISLAVQGEYTKVGKLINSQSPKFLDNLEEVEPESGRSILAFLCTDPKGIEEIKILLNHGANPNTIDLLGMSPLHLTCRNYSLEMSHELIKMGAAINAKDNNGKTPLSYAIFGYPKHRPAKLVRLLIEHGANPSETNNWGRSPNDLANAYKDAELQSLLKGGSSH